MGKLRISDEAGVTVFAILVGLAVVCFTAWIFSTGGCAGETGKKITPVPENSPDPRSENQP